MRLPTLCLLAGMGLALAGLGSCSSDGQARDVGWAFDVAFVPPDGAAADGDQPGAGDTAGSDAGDAEGDGPATGDVRPETGDVPPDPGDDGDGPPDSAVDTDAADGDAREGDGGGAGDTLRADETGGELPGPDVDVTPCVPDCTDRQCGGDGCGGFCGACPVGEQCTGNHRCIAATWQCGDVPTGGLCIAGPGVVYCEGGLLFAEFCDAAAEACLWDPAAGRRACLPRPPPTLGVDALTPDHGPVGGGTPVVITGAGFVSGLTVAFGAAEPVPASYASATRVTCTTPPAPDGLAGPVAVTFSAPGVETLVVENAFTYEAEPILPVVNGIEPDTAPEAGGVEVVLRGARLAGVTAVVFDDLPATPSVPPSDAEVRVVAPPHAAGVVDLTVESSTAPPLLLPAAFTYTGPSDPAVDGVIGADWAAGDCLTLNGVASDWSGTPLPYNVLHRLCLTVLGDELFLAIEGQVEAHNAIVLYLDADYGAGTGLTTARDCTDAAPAVDNALCVSETDPAAAPLTVADPDFGAEIALASVGMAGYAGAGYPTCSDLGQSTGAGWRRLTPPGDLPWLCGQVVSTADAAGGRGVVEARIPLETVFGAAVPAEGATLALFVRIVNGAGTHAANQSLPEFEPPAADPGRVGAVAVFPVPPSP